jgi:hypothetical protein
MIAEYVRKHNGKETVLHKVEVGSPMDIELRRQLQYMESVPGPTFISRRVKKKEKK